MKSGIVVAKLIDARGKKYNIILRTNDIDEMQEDFFRKTREVLDLHGHSDSKLLNADAIEGKII